MRPSGSSPVRLYHPTHRRIIADQLNDGPGEFAIGMPGTGEAVEFAVLVGSLGTQFAFVIPFLLGAVSFAVLVRRHGLSFAIAMPHGLVVVRLTVLVGVRIVSGRYQTKRSVCRAVCLGCGLRSGVVYWRIGR